MADLKGENPTQALPIDDKKRAEIERISNIYRGLLFSSFTITIIIIFIVSSLFIIHSAEILAGPPSFLMTVILAGTLGAMFSMLTRLYAYTDLPHILSDPNIPEPSRLHKLIYGAIPPVTGAIAATVLYLCFAGNILGGGIFPEIACRGEGASCESFQGLIDNYGPKKGVDYAKALVWGFIAGFAERLVPNVLGSLAQQAEQQANK